MTNHQNAEGANSLPTAVALNGESGVVYPKSGPELNFLNVHQMILEDKKLFRQSSLL